MNHQVSSTQNPRDIQWNTMYEILYRYYKKHGNVNVSYSAKNPELRKLAKWIACQRQRYIKHTLPDREYELLNKIQFRWTQRTNIYDNKWMEQYEKLKEYAKKNNGSTKVTTTENAELGLWVANQRKLYVATNLKQHRIDLLNDINFQWVIQNKAPKQLSNQPTEFDKKWNRMYEQLKEYRTKYGHCNVPFDYPINPSLAIWVANQRRIYHQRCWNDHLEMPTQRRQLLDDIGFRWSIDWYESHDNTNRNHYRKSYSSTTKKIKQEEEEEEDDNVCNNDDANNETDTVDENYDEKDMIKNEYSKKKRKYKQEDYYFEADDSISTDDEIKIPKKNNDESDTTRIENHPK